MHDNAPDADGVRGMDRAERRIAHQRAPNSLSLPCLVHSQSTENYGRDRVRHISPKIARCECLGDGARRKGVIASDTPAVPFVIARHIDAACPFCVISPRSLA